MVDFSHLEAGTSEAEWRGDPRADRAPELGVVDHLVVVAAHPDDETLGAGGLMRRVHSRGGRVTVVLATDGEASHPHSRTTTPAQLAGRRRVEVIRALDVLAPGARVHFLAIPDGMLRENAATLRAELGRILADATASADNRNVTIVTPWSGDGHRDHRIVAECTGSVAATRGIRHLGYPIWLWHWGRPDDVPWQDAVGLTLTQDERDAKTAALAVHVSQTEPLSPQAGDEPIVHAGMLAHFARARELYIDETTMRDAEGPRPVHGSTLPAQYFDAFHARHDDPWGFETRWYEARKRAVLLASMPEHGLGGVLEIGCSTGVLTAELAARADSVCAMDASQHALDRARERLAAQHPGERVRFVHGAVPDDWPDGRFATIVFSEVGYYLSPDDLQRTIDRLDEALADDGFLVACHWRHTVSDYPQSGDQVHAALRAAQAWEVLVAHEEEDFVLEVFCRRPAASVARREGLL